MKTTNSKAFEITVAKGCAWRAVYVKMNGRQVAHLGVDPHDGVTPQMFGSVAGRAFRLPLPTVRWKMNAGPAYLRAYKAARAFWFGVDGRYGVQSANR